MTGPLLADVAVFEGLLFPLVNLAVLATWAYVLVDLFKNPRLSGGAKGHVARRDRSAADRRRRDLPRCA
jgi:hypothetical protein